MVPDIDPSFEMMNKAFTTFPEVDFILWFCPITAKLAPYMTNILSEVDGSRLPSGMESTKVYVAHRSKFAAKLMVREAVIEDNDDLLPILQLCSPHIVADQDDFFLAKLIQSQDHRNRIFVGVEKNRPVGMLSTSLDVNVSFIRNIFDLSNYPDLIVDTEVETKSTNIIVLVCGNMINLDDNVLYNLAIDLQCAFVDAADIMEDPQDLSVDDSILLLEKAITNAMGEGDSSKSCIVTGFPRSIEDVDAFLQSGLTFEVVCCHGDPEAVVDVAMKSHIHAVEAMKSKSNLVGVLKNISS